MSSLSVIITYPLCGEVGIAECCSVEILGSNPGLCAGLNSGCFYSSFSCPFCATVLPLVVEVLIRLDMKQWCHLPEESPTISTQVERPDRNLFAL